MEGRKKYSYEEPWQFTTKILYVDNENQIYYTLINESESVFKYHIREETWEYYCKHRDWADFAESLGIDVKRTKKGRTKKEKGNKND